MDFTATDWFSNNELFESFQNEQECNKIPDYFVPDNYFTKLPSWAQISFIGYGPTIIPVSTGIISIAFGVGNLIVLFSSISGNIGALWILYWARMSTKSTKTFLMSLATCDLILALTSPTVDLTQLISLYRSWILGSFLCRLIPFLQTAASVGVAIFLTVIAAERYLQIVGRFRGRETGSWSSNLFNCNFKSYITIVVMGWVISLLLALPNLWYFTQKSFWTFILDQETGEQIRPRNETCTKFYYICTRSSFDDGNIAYYSVLGLAFLIPTICFIFCYISILTFVQKHEKFMNEAEIRSSKKTKTTLKLILRLIGMNLLCRGPIWFFIILTSLKDIPATVTVLIVKYGLHLLSNINTVLNPFVYCIWNKSIRSRVTFTPNCGDEPNVTIN